MPKRKRGNKRQRKLFKKKLFCGPAIESSCLRSKSDDPSGVRTYPVVDQSVTGPKISLHRVLGSVTNEELQLLRRQIESKTLRMMNIM